MNGMNGTDEGSPARGRRPGGPRRWLGALLACGLALAAAAAAPSLTAAATGGTLAARAGTPQVPAGTAQDPSPATSLFLDRLAAALGLPRDRLEEAVRHVLTGMVDQAAQQGQMTEERAQALRQRIDQGAYRLLPPFGRPERARPGRGRGDRWHGGFVPGRGLGAGLPGLLEAAGEAMGLTPGQVLDRLLQGQTLAAIAQERGVSREALVDALVAPIKARLDAAVAAGRLTEEQARRKQERLEGWAEQWLDRSLRPAPGTTGDPGEAASSPSPSM